MTIKQIAKQLAEMLRDGDLFALANSDDGDDSVNVPAVTDSDVSDGDVTEPAAPAATVVAYQCAANALCVAVAQAVNELRGDFPSVVAVTVCSVNGVINVCDIAPDVRFVVGVQRQGRRVPFGYDGVSITVGADGEYTVYYAAQSPISVGVDMTAPDSYAVLYLASRNYCMFFGRYDQAEIYDRMYNAEAERLRLKRRARLPKRVFI